MVTSISSAEDEEQLREEVREVFTASCEDHCHPRGRHVVHEGRLALEDAEADEGRNYCQASLVRCCHEVPVHDELDRCH